MSSHRKSQDQEEERVMDLWREQRVSSVYISSAEAG